MKNNPSAATTIATNYPDAMVSILKGNPAVATSILKNNPAVSANIVKKSPGAAAELLDKHPEAAGAIMRSAPTPGTASAAMPSDQPNSFLTSAVGGFLGAGFGSLLGSAAGASLSRGGYETNGSSQIQNDIMQSVIAENVALKAEHDHHDHYDHHDHHDHHRRRDLRDNHDHPGISITPNTMYMREYEEPKDTKWTRGGPSIRYRAKHQRRNIDEFNEEDPESLRWPGKNIEPTNLYPLRKEMSNRNRRLDGDDETCDTSEFTEPSERSEPLTKKFNVERDYSRD
jgi:hypothetical protein